MGTCFHLQIIYRGEFRRRPRESYLCFLGQHGMLDSFRTDGTFTRIKFFQCIRTFATKSGKVQVYPGFHSVWILDGARIHCDKNIILYLRSIGILPIFLPSYCPMLNPIESIFGLVKKYLKRHYKENDKKPLSITITEAFTRFSNYDCTRLFNNCGYLNGGNFDPEVGLGQSIDSFDG